MSKVFLYSLLVLLIVGIASVSAQQVGDECVVPEPLRQGLYAAHPSDCASYLQCIHGRFVARACARGLQWSTFHNACNWPQFSDCTLAAARVDQPFQGVDV